MRRVIINRKLKKEAIQTKDFVADFKDLESTQFAQTLTPAKKKNDVKYKHDYQVDPIYKSEDIKRQVYEVRGLSLKDKNYEYHTPLYRDLLSLVVPLRK